MARARLSKKDKVGTNGNNTSYRIGTPSKAIVAAGIKKLYGTSFAYGS